MKRAAIAVFLVACGGASSNAHDVSVPPAPSASASSSSAVEPALPERSVVHYDDLGITFAVPRLLHVMGDDELASRVRASASAHLTANLQSRASDKKGVPLLALSATDINVTLLVVAVPPDATASELTTHQHDAMTLNLKNFQMTTPIKEITTDGVAGEELEARYVLGDVGMASRSRVWVRNGVGTILTVAWKENANVSAIVRDVLDGLHFQPLK